MNQGTTVRYSNYVQGVALLILCLFFMPIGLPAQDTLWSDNNTYTLSTIDDVTFVMPGEPGLITFQAKRSVLGIGDLYLEALVAGSWVQIAQSSLESSYQVYGPFQLPHQATQIRFSSRFGATLSKYVTQIVVTRAQYIEAEVAPFSQNQYIDTLPIYYAGVGSVIEASISSNYFTIISPTSGLLATDFTGRTNLQIQFQPDTIGYYSAQLTLTSLNVQTQVQLVGSYLLAANQQHIEWNMPQNHFKIGDTLFLDATATSGLPVSYTLLEPGVVTLHADTLIAISVGEAQIIASQGGNSLFMSAPTVRSYVWVDNVLELTTASQNSCWKLYPNPARKQVCIDGQNILRVTLFTTTAHTIAAWDQIQSDHCCLDLPILLPGFYLLRVENQSLSQTFKLFIH